MIRATLLGWLHEAALWVARVTMTYPLKPNAARPSYRVVDREDPAVSPMDTRISIAVPPIGSSRPGMAALDDKTLAEVLEKHFERAKRLGGDAS